MSEKEMLVKGPEVSINQDAQETIIWEYQVTEAKGGSVYSVERPFTLKVVDGPVCTIKKGQFVGLSAETGEELFFSNRVLPVDIPDSGEYEVLRLLTIVTEDGKYRRVKPGEILQLNRDEAITFL